VFRPHCHHQGADTILEKFGVIKLTTMLTRIECTGYNLDCMKCYKLLIIRLLQKTAVTEELRLSGRWLTGSPIIWIGLALRINIFLL